MCEREREREKKKKRKLEKDIKSGREIDRQRQT